MPTYQYACTACHHQLEAVQSFTDDPLTQCPVCDGQLRKLFGSVGIVFRGPGFYRTDSRNGSSGNGSHDGKAGDNAASKPSANGSANGKETSGSANGKETSGSGGGKEKAPATTSSTASA